MSHAVIPYDAGAHEAFVYGTWLSAYAGAPSVKSLPRDLYYAYQRCLIASLLERATTLVAEDAGLLLGWACAERAGPRLVAGHFVFVKARDRELGIAADLMAALGHVLEVTCEDRIVATHSQKPFSHWLYRKGWGYEPRYLAERNHEEETR